MKYKSTRGGGSHEYYTFEEALLRGYAPDGGLFVPTSLPTIAAECLRSWSSLPYPELAYNVLVSSTSTRASSYFGPFLHLIIHHISSLILSVVAYVHIAVGNQ